MSSFTRKLLLMIIPLIVAIMGCRTPKNITYFQDLEEGSVVQLPDSAELRLRKGDKVFIIVHTRIPELSAQFNLSISSNRIGHSSLNNTYNQVASYIVNDDGTIDFPELGTLKVENLTRYEVVELVKNKLKEGEYFINDDFVVTVEFDNMYFTVLGEVTKQGRYAITKDRLTILEALGMAGDMSIQGQRFNVKVLRDDGDNNKKIYSLDFTDASQVMTSPCYYIKQNDVLYVEANDIRKRQSTVNGNTVRSGSFWMSLASLLSSLYVIFIR